MECIYNDGGRRAAGYKGIVGDCATRAIAIACNLPYKTAYDLVNAAGKKERRSKRRRHKSYAPTGVYGPTMRRIMDSLGWVWHPTMNVGQGCRVHLRKEELPAGPLIAAVSRHYVAVIDGVIHDNHNPDRGGTRCVYGYFTPPAAS